VNASPINAPLLRRLALAPLLALLLAPLPASAFDLQGLGQALGVNPETMKHIEQGVQLTQALIPISDREEIELGRSVAARVIGRYGLVHDRRQTYYLNLVGDTLASRSDRPNLPYHFAILDTNDVNAYACPGGFIFVTRGAMDMVKDEAELAAILAHEISHVTERHIVKALQHSKMMKVGSEVAAEAFRSQGALFTQMTDFATDALFKGLSKEDEYDADAKAVVYLDRLGYDYLAMNDVLRLLQQRQRMGLARVLSRTHPSPASRIRHLDAAERDLGLPQPSHIRLANRFARYTENRKEPS
jgi:beta-barrel assembly-enhancing protease